MNLLLAVAIDNHVISFSHFILIMTHFFSKTHKTMFILSS